jgi:hypothetical protein
VPGRTHQPITPAPASATSVLVIPGPEGGAIGPTEAEFAGYEVVEATEEEKARLAEAGYRLKGLDTLGALIMRTSLNDKDLSAPLMCH